MTYSIRSIHLRIRLVAHLHPSAYVLAFTLLASSVTAQTSSPVHSLHAPADLAIDRVLQEPVVAQPVFLNFDERGRMWVVQYLQYPHPAGLTVVAHDESW